MPGFRYTVRRIALLLAVAGISATVSAQVPESQLAAATPLPEAMHTMHALHVYANEESDQSPRSIAMLPAHIVIQPALHEIVDSMLRSSPTFRRQCARLMSASALTVTVVRGIPAAQQSFASTRMMTSPDGHLYAVVHLGPGAALDELIAHEFEHIIEQLDGVDLAAMAKRPGTGVKELDEAGCFETDRARTIGRQVALEVRSAGE